MRTEAQADRIVRKALFDQTGSAIPDGFILNFSTSTLSQLSGLFVGRLSMIGLDIAPRRYWESFSSDGLYALPVHEIQNAKHDFLPIEKRKNTALHRLKKKLDAGEIDEIEYKKRRLVRLVYWEVKRHVMQAATHRKLLVDWDTYLELKRLGKNPSCFLEFLTSEKQEELAKVVPSARTVTHALSLEIRIRHFTLLCNRAFSHAAQLRKRQKRHYELVCSL